MGYKKIIKLSLVYIISFVISSFIFILFFWTDLFIAKNSLFFRCIILLLIICFITFLFLLILKKTKKITFILYRDIFIICLLLFFVNYNIYTIIPFNVSRSNSILIVGYLYKKKGNPVDEKEIKNFVLQKYFYEYDAIKLRLNEQVDIGNVKKIEDGYILTKKGEFTIKMFSFITDLYRVKNNFAKIE